MIPAKIAQKLKQRSTEKYIQFNDSSLKGDHWYRVTSVHFSPNVAAGSAGRAGGLAGSIRVNTPLQSLAGFHRLALRTTPVKQCEIRLGSMRLRLSRVSIINFNISTEAVLELDYEKMSVSSGDSVF